MIQISDLSLRQRTALAILRFIELKGSEQPKTDGQQSAAVALMGDMHRDGLLIASVEPDGLKYMLSNKGRSFLELHRPILDAIIASIKESRK